MDGKKPLSTCFALVALCGGCGYPRLARDDMVELAEAAPVQYWSLDGNRIFGVDSIDNGYLFHRAIGEASSLSGVGTWYEYRNGRLVETYEGLPPDSLRRKWGGKWTP